MIIQLKILHGLARKIVGDRELRKVYQTNRIIKYYGFYCALKSMTNSGLIQNYPEQIEQICGVVKKSKSSFYTYMHECVQLGLIEKNGLDIKLSSWNKLIDQFGIRDKKFTEFSYDITKKEQTPEYFLISAEINENQYYQASNVTKQIRQNPQIKELLNEKEISIPTVKRLHHIQVYTFMNGCGGSEMDYNIIHSLNADVQRSVPKLRRDFNLKSNKSVAYLKKQLVERGFAEVTRRIMKSAQRMRKKRTEYHTGWDKIAKKSMWQLPDSITLIVC